MPGRDATRGPAVLAFVSVLALVAFSTACSIRVEEPQRGIENGQRVAMSTSAAPLPQYQVAISAIDFDPPLRRDVLLNPRQPIKLVAAVENKGLLQLNRLAVEARVVNQKGDFSVEDEVSLDKLAPGETRVVEFRLASPASTLPRSPSFKISVFVDSPQLDPALPRPARELTVRVLDQ